MWSDDSEYSKIALIVGQLGHSVLTPIIRPDEVPNVTSINGIKTKYFCFMRISHNEIGSRKFSCDCQPCVNAGPNAWRIGNQCENFDQIGPWKRHQVLPDDGTWSLIYSYLEEEGGTLTRYGMMCAGVCLAIVMDTQRWVVVREEHYSSVHIVTMHSICHVLVCVREKKPPVVRGHVQRV